MFIARQKGHQGLTLLHDRTHLSQMVDSDWPFGDSRCHSADCLQPVYLHMQMLCSSVYAKDRVRDVFGTCPLITLLKRDAAETAGILDGIYVLVGSHLRKMLRSG
jgi:hypothetical protein